MPTNDTTPRTSDPKAYLDRILHLLRDSDRLSAANARIAAETKALTRVRRDELKPTWGRACLTLGKTVLAVVTAMGLGWGFAGVGLWPLTGLLLPVAAVALYGGLSILHDTVHGSFFPSRRANRILGEVIAPLFAMDFGTFRRSHMQHHKHNQSLTHDPKYPKVPWPAEVIGEEEAGRREVGVVARIMRSPILGWFALSRRMLACPGVVRHAFYAASVMILGGPVALLFGGELSLLQRDWRAGAVRFSLARTLLLYGLLAWFSPLLGVLALGAIWMALGCFFVVYLTHLTPYQIYMEGRNPAVRLFSLNITDIDVGPLTRALGNSFTEHHSAHHLVPFAPCYRLSRVDAWVGERLGDLKAPSLRLGKVEDATFLGDGIIRSITGPRESAWPQWETAQGTFVSRGYDVDSRAGESPSLSLSQLMAVMR